MAKTSDNGRTEREIDLGPLDGFIGFNLRNAQETTFRAFARHVGAEGLKPGRFAALMVIHHNPGLTQRDLGRAIARDKSTVTPLIQDLQRRGLIERRPSTSDRRSMTLRLTAAGEASLDQMLSHAHAHDRKLDEIVGDQKALFLDLLKRVAAEIS